MTYTLEFDTSRPITLEECYKADRAIKSGMLEGDETWAEFHSLTESDIHSAVDFIVRELPVSGEIVLYEEHLVGCICNLVQICTKKGRVNQPVTERRTL